MFTYNSFPIMNIQIHEDKLSHLVAKNIPYFLINTSNITTMDSLFRFSDYRKVDTTWIEDWDVSNVLTFRRMFTWDDVFNRDISWWDVGNGVNFESMFKGCKMFNQDISNWKMFEHFSYEKIEASEDEKRDAIFRDKPHSSRIPSVENMFFEAHNFSVRLKWPFIEWVRKMLHMPMDKSERLKSFKKEAKRNILWLLTCPLQMSEYPELVTVLDVARRSVFTTIKNMPIAMKKINSFAHLFWNSAYEIQTKLHFPGSIHNKNRTRWIRTMYIQWWHLLEKQWHKPKYIYMTVKNNKLPNWDISEWLISPWYNVQSLFIFWKTYEELYITPLWEENL